MSRTAIGPLFRTAIADVKTAFALLTRIPVKANFDRTQDTIWAFPVVGAVIGGGVLIIALLGNWIGLGLGVSAGLAIAAGVIITGAMHEDGLADSADGLWGGWEPARRLEIMRDSHIGTYGVVALILAFLLRFSVLTSVLDSFDVGILIAAAALSRAAMGFVMTLLPHARDDGLSVRTGRPNGRIAALGGVVALVISLGLTGFVPTVIAGSACAAVIFVVFRIAKAKIGGQTGDILGATQILSEIAVLAALSTL